MNRLFYIRDLDIFLISSVGLVAGFFDTTITFIYALLLGFTFNIVAGFRADEVKFKMWRLLNFKGNKFKDSLFELLLIMAITYILKGIMDLMKYNEKSVYAVQVLIGIAVYFYVRNGLRNLSGVYPKIKWLKVLYVLVAFKFKELMPESVNEAVDQVEKEEEKEDATNK